MGGSGVHVVTVMYFFFPFSHFQVIRISVIGSFADANCKVEGVEGIIEISIEKNVVYLF